MYFTLPTIALAASILLPAAHANFDIYRVTRYRPLAQGGTDVIWQAFKLPPSCDLALKSAYWYDSSDVSGDKLGFRCKGSGCSAQAPADNIDQLEMHFRNNPLWHWTIYKDRGRSMIGSAQEQTQDFSSSLYHPFQTLPGPIRPSARGPSRSRNDDVPTSGKPTDASVHAIKVPTGPGYEMVEEVPETANEAAAFGMSPEEDLHRTLSKDAMDEIAQRLKDFGAIGHEDL
ncbi:hypothetical protein VE03_02216 [Pseudogymnoascus sp. 23342-1-I1]|nr:hypothetical protein VE03_02216 [Pseudogymnoascus sp. 23342-1-I1]